MCNPVYDIILSDKSLHKNLSKSAVLFKDVSQLLSIMLCLLLQVKSRGGMSGVQDDIVNISRHFSGALHDSPLAVQIALGQCRSADGTYNMLNVMEQLLKLSTVRNCLEGISCHGN